jgi:hypothetical protein
MDDCPEVQRRLFLAVSADPYLLAVLNSPLMWWHNWRYLPHMKDEALSPVAFLMESLPVASPSDAIRAKCAAAVGHAVEIAAEQQETRRAILDWLRVQYDIGKPSMNLQSPADLDSDGFVGEVAKVRGKKKLLTAAALKVLRDEYTRTIEPMRKRAAEGMNLLRRHQRRRAGSQPVPCLLLPREKRIFPLADHQSLKSALPCARTITPSSAFPGRRRTRRRERGPRRK